MFIDMMLLQNLVILRFHFHAYMMELMIHSEFKKETINSDFLSFFNSTVLTSLNGLLSL